MIGAGTGQALPVIATLTLFCSMEIEASGSDVRVRQYEQRWPKLPACIKRAEQLPLATILSDTISA